MNELFIQPAHISNEGERIGGLHVGLVMRLTNRNKKIWTLTSISESLMNAH